MVNSLTRKLMLLIATVVVMLLVSGRLFTNSHLSALNEQAAKQLVLKHVPKTAIHLETRAQTGHFDFLYYDIPTRLHYLIDVDSRTGEVNEVKASLENPDGSAKVLIDERIVRRIIGRRFKAAEIESVQLQAELGSKRFRVAFSWTGLQGLASVNPETGQLLEYSLQSSPRAAIPAVAEPRFTAQAIAVASQLPVDRIQAIALNHVVGGVIADTRQVQEAQGVVYQVQVIKDETRYSLAIDAATGLVRSIVQVEGPYPEISVRLPERS